MGVEAHHPEAYVGEDVLQADLAEATTILAPAASTTDPLSALAATGGWVAGLVFESWQADGAVGVDPLGAYFATEFRPMIGESLFTVLVETSVFETVTVRRLALLGHVDPLATLSALRRLAVPAILSSDGASMWVHPRVRELLRTELERWPVEQVQALKVAAAAVLEREGEVERAVELLVASGAIDEARLLLPRVIVAIAERGDVHVAERLLEACEPTLGPDADPAIHLAALMVSSARQNAAEANRRVLDGGRWDDPEWLRALLGAEPRIAPFGCIALTAVMRLQDAMRLLDLTPPGRSRDTVRLVLSSVPTNDDPDAAPPPLLGDALDPIIARGLWFRGRLLELHDGMDERLAGTAGVPDFVRMRGPKLIEVGGLGALLADFTHAVEHRDLEETRRAIAALSTRPSPLWEVMCRAEAAVRVARDPSRVARALARFHEFPVARLHFYREVMQVWEGGGLLLAERDAAQVGPYGRSGEHASRADRRLELSTALVYLAEADWRLGNEDAADAATEEAYRVASEQGSLRRLMLALSDFPGVVSRRIDAEPAADSDWHLLGRGLTVGVTSVSRAQIDAGAVRLREFGGAGPRPSRGRKTPADPEEPRAALVPRVATGWAGDARRGADRSLERARRRIDPVVRAPGASSSSGRIARGRRRREPR